MGEGSGREPSPGQRPSPSGGEAQSAEAKGERSTSTEQKGSGGEQGKEGGGGSQSSQGEGKQGQKEKPSRAEWVVGVVCAAVVLAAVGYLFYRALSRPDLPPLIAVHAERVVPTRSGFLVEIRMVNEGSRTAANLMVEGALMQDTVAVEKSTATIDFVPAETERRGGLYFTKDPSRYRLEVRPMGYDVP